MATFTVVRFPTAGGAERMLHTWQELQQQHPVSIQDAAGVVWPRGAQRPETTQLPQPDFAGRGALDSAFWGLLFGLIFLAPLLELTADASSGSLASQFADYGIDDDFIQQMRDKVTEGTSALFLMSGEDMTDRIVDAGAGMTFEIITANLSKAEEERLHTTFAAPDEQYSKT